MMQYYLIITVLLLITLVFVGAMIPSPSRVPVAMTPVPRITRMLQATPVVEKENDVCLVVDSTKTVRTIKERSKQKTQHIESDIGSNDWDHNIEAYLTLSPLFISSAFDCYIFIYIFISCCSSFPYTIHTGHRHVPTLDGWNNRRLFGCFRSPSRRGLYERRGQQR